jgi:hypothetical protein
MKPLLERVFVVASLATWGMLFPSRALYAIVIGRHR